MEILEISIRGITHKISCKPEDKENLLSIAEEFKTKVNSLAQVLTSADSKTLYLIASLTFMSELKDLKNQSTYQDSSASIEESDMLSESLDTITKKIESITQDLNT